MMQLVYSYNFKLYYAFFIVFALSILPKILGNLEIIGEFYANL